MNLQEHKEMLDEYEQILRQMREMRKVQPEQEWSACTAYNRVNIPLPADYAQTLLREHLLSMEKRAREMAATLGFTFEFPAESPTD